MKINKINRSVHRLASDFSTDRGEHFVMDSDKDGILYLKVSADWDGEEYSNKGHYLYYECFQSHDVRTMFVRARRSVHQYWFKKYGHYIWVKSQHLDTIKR
jgi:hypothetical protein